MDLLLGFIRSAAKIFSKLFGQLVWQRPVWLNALSAYLRMHKSVFSASIVLLALLMVGSYFSYRWYQAQPRPEYIAAEVIAPEITPLAKELIPQPLHIRFGVKHANGVWESKSVAPLNQIDKALTSGVSLSPGINGEWRWQGDAELVFYPQQDWLADQRYRVRFDKTVFAPQATLKMLTYDFTTKPLQASIAEVRFYQDPLNPRIQRVVATVNFNFPIDPRSVQDHTILVLQQVRNNKLDVAAKHFPYTIRFDEHKRTAYIQSETVALTENGYYLALVVDKGIKALTGTAKTQSSITQSVLVPGSKNVVRVQKVDASIIRNENDRPEQLLTIEMTAGVTAAALQQAIEVYLLPPLPDNKQWTSPSQVSADVLTPERRVKLQAVPTEQEYSSLHSYKLQVTPGCQLYVVIKKGMTGYGGYKLAQSYAALISGPEYPKEIAFLHKGSLLALNDEKKLSVLIRGVPAVKFEIAKVLTTEINHLITQTRGDFSNPQFLHQYDFNERNISQVFTEVKEFNQEANTDQLQYTALDLARYLKKQEKTPTYGLFLLKAQGWNAKEGYTTDPESRRLVLVTDMGMIIKDNSDGSHDIFVQSILQGLPVANVQIQALGVNGESVSTHITDSNGHVHFNSLRDFKNEHEPVVYLARKGGDLSFIPYEREDRHLNYSRFDIGGERTDLQEKQLTAFLFTDRGVYRPGDMLHLGAIVRQPYAQNAPANIPVELVITDPRGSVVHRQKQLLPINGYVALDYKTQETSPTGQYNIELDIIKDEHFGGILGSTAVNVEEFLPDRLRVRSEIIAPPVAGWVNPAHLTAAVHVWNLFGTPAADRKVTGKLILKPKSFRFKTYPQYVFIDPLLDPKKPPKILTEELPDTKTNQQGIAKFELGLERFGKTTYELNFYAQGFDAESGRGVASQSAILVSPLAYLVGYKTDGELNYIKQGSQRSVQFIAINPDLKLLMVDGLEIKILQQHPVSTLVKKPDGTYTYQSVQQETPISRQRFQLNAQPTTVSLPTTRIGDFVLVIQNQQGIELSRVKFTVVGASQQSIPQNAELSVKLNKTSYHSGDPIELQITAPYAGAGLITIERDKVYAYRWFKMNTNSSVQRITLPKDFIGNGYVNVALLRDWNSSEIFISPLSYSVQPFSVSREAHQVNIELAAPSIIQPGKLLTVGYKMDKPGKIIVYAVDEGILQVTHYAVPDPLNYFFLKQALGVTTSQTLDQILPKFILKRELSAVGGDALHNLLTDYINPFKRKTDKPVIYWSGIIDADTTLRQITYPIPETFNGSLKIMAVAAAADAVGAQEKTVTVKGDYVLTVNAPTFVAPGDEFTVGVNVANIQGNGQPVAIGFTASPHLQLRNNSIQKLVLPVGQEQTAVFAVKATDQLGAADITFQLTDGLTSLKTTASVSVRPSTPFLTTLTAGMTDARQNSIPVKRELYPQFRLQTLALSSSPLILTQGLHRYLNNFPYVCTEQLISKAFALLALADQPVLGITPAQAREKFTAIIQTLRERQLANGGFSYWPGAGGENEAAQFASVYALHFLTEAKQWGYPVPEELLNNGIGYLKEIAAGNANSIETARLQAYAIYLLTRNEIVTSDYLTNLQLLLEKKYSRQWRGDITAVYMAGTYALLKKQGEAEQLIAVYKLGSKPELTTDFFKPATNDMQYLIILAKHFPNRLQRLGNNSVIKNLIFTIAQNNLDTLSAAYASLALKGYEQSLGSEPLKKLSLLEIDRQDRRQPLQITPGLYHKADISGASKAIEIHNDDNKPYFYLLSQEGFDKQPIKKGLAEGVEVYREYRDVTGKKVTQAKVGTDVEVHITLRSLSQKSIRNVAVLDLLPGGFEVVRESVLRDQVDYADIREDRVVFFTTATPETSKIVYKIRATNSGQYIIPPVTVAAMYNPFIKGQDAFGSRFVVSPH